MVIDVHAHYFPPEYLESLNKLSDEAKGPLAWGWKSTIERAVLGDPLMYGDMDERIRLMDVAGIDLQVLSLSMPNVYFADSEESLRLARLSNDCFAELQRKYQSRILGLASVPLTNVAMAVDELRRAVKGLGLRGVLLGSNVMGKPLDSPEFDPFYAEVERLGAVIVIHPMVPASAAAYSDYDLLSMVGLPVDSTLAVLRLIFSGILDRYPNIKVILPHLGGPVLFLWERIEQRFLTPFRGRASMMQPPSYYLKNVYYDCVSFHLPAMRCVRDTVGSGQMLLGTDFPYVSHGNLSRAVESVRRLELPPDETENVLGENAAKLFAVS